MLYALIVNDIIEVGPRSWHYRMFKEYLEDELLDTTSLPRQASNEPILTDTWKILPVIEPNSPDLDYPYEQPAGPFWTINANNIITGTWDKAPVSLEISKGTLKETVTNNRYNLEIQGIKVSIQNQEVSIDTTREGRNVYIETFVSMNDNDIVNWKFAEGWLTLTKTDMNLIVTAINTHIQNAFTWEQEKHNEILNATTKEQLKAINLNVS